MNTIRVLTALLLSSLASACATSKGPDLSRAPEMYYNQERAAELVSVRNIDRLTMEGDGMQISISTQLPQLSMIPKQPSVVETLAREVPRALVTGLGIVTMGDVMSSMASQPRTVDPLVVQPEIVEVPVMAQ